MICPTCATGYPADIRFCPSDGSILRPIASEAVDLVGRIIDARYYLVEKVGQGGMGEVYRAEHVRTHGRCAVKIINRALAQDPEALSRFIREATNAGSISHPNVAAVHDFGETDDGLLYLAQEYVDGESLSALLDREGALPLARAIDIGRQVADAVGAAHELGIVHRDLKPNNVMLVRDRKGGDLVKVVDFGIARATGDEQQRLTRTGLVIGTPEYMSPEQLISDPVDGRSDIYSLGCILYQMLTGEHAFGGSTAHVITRRLTEPPPRPRDKNPEVPGPLDDVIVKALGRTPAERFSSMDELREALIAAPSAPATKGAGLLARFGLKIVREEPRGEAATAPDTGQRGARRTPSGSTPVPPPSDPISIFASSEAPPPPADEPAPAAEPDPVDLLPPDPDPPFVPVADPEALDASLDDRLGGEELVPADVVDDAGAPVEREVTEEFPAATEERRQTRRNLLPIAGAVGAVAAVGILVFALTRPDPSVVTDPPPDAIGAVVLPPSPLPDSALAAARAELSLAGEENENRRFPESIRRLDSLQVALAGMSAQYPRVAEIQLLTDSAAALRSRVVIRCGGLREVNIARNLPAPDCGDGTDELRSAP